MPAPGVDPLSQENFLKTLKSLETMVYASSGGGVVARLPKALDPLVKFFLGVRLDRATGALKPVATYPLNAGPAPLGYVAPKSYGLQPGFYLPDSVISGAPSWLPGAPEAAARQAEKKADLNRFYADLEARKLNGQLQLMSTEDLDALYTSLSPGGRRRGTYFDPDNLMRLISAEGTRRRDLSAQLAEERAKYMPVQNPQIPGTADAPMVNDIPVNPSDLAPYKALGEILGGIGPDLRRFFFQSGNYGLSYRQPAVIPPASGPNTPAPSQPTVPQQQATPAPPVVPGVGPVGPTPPVVTPNDASASPSGKPIQDQPQGRFGERGLPINPTPTDAPGTTPGQRQYGPQGPIPTGPTPDAFFARKNGDP